MKLVILLWILPVTLGDIDVTCMYSAECLLPCTSTIHLDIIHWYKDSKPVHSFYYNKDQLDHQSEDYKGRTSLLPESEIKNGNVSLLLKNIRVQDEGRYRCYTANDNTNDEKFVSVSVEAPVESVNITLKDDTVICKTSGVYPKPQVSWSSGNEPVNTFQETEEKLFIVTSELKVGDISGSYKYTCSITSKGRTKTATLEQQGLETVYMCIVIIAPTVIVIAIAIAVVILKKKQTSSLENGTDQENVSLKEGKTEKNGFNLNEDE